MILDGKSNARGVLRTHLDVLGLALAGARSRATFGTKQQVLQPALHHVELRGRGLESSPMPATSASPRGVLALALDAADLLGQLLRAPAVLRYGSGALRPLERGEAPRGS
ncbi:hypothetical protein ACH51_05745 [Ralstonia solanacearum]|nr:hypothetical protein ACH51_05745 [Ralstonia solanacearum]